MHSRMRITVLLQRDLLVRSGIPIDSSFVQIFHPVPICTVQSYLISARGGRDRREIELFQGLLHAAQWPTAKITNNSCQCERGGPSASRVNFLRQRMQILNDRRTARTASDQLSKEKKNNAERNHHKMKKKEKTTIFKIHYIRLGHLERGVQSSYLAK